VIDREARGAQRSCLDGDSRTVSQGKCSFRYTISLKCNDPSWNAADGNAGVAAGAALLLSRWTASGYALGLEPIACLATVCAGEPAIVDRMWTEPHSEEVRSIVESVIYECGVWVFCVLPSPPPSSFISSHT
jgi:hypothetical protein